ncbi:MAG: hypothetical protein AAF928_05480 [Myxococcota bacterium]
MAAAACGSDGDIQPPDTSTGGGTGGDTGEGGGLAGVGGFPVEQLVLEPANGTILVDNGTSMPLQLTATVGGEQVFPSSWSVDRGIIANVDVQGLVTATDERGGEVEVRAEYQGLVATATVTVRYEAVIDDVGLSPSDRDLLRTATNPDSQVQWQYPYDGTVWPQGLLAPEMMWEGSEVGDVFYVHLVGDFVDVEVFRTADPPSRLPLDASAWVAVSESGSNTGSVGVDVARLSAGAATVVVDHGWKMATAPLRGTVYYWATNLGRIVRIKPGADAPDDFLQAAGVTGCTACHTVSANGQRLAIGGDVSASSYDLVNDTTVLELGGVGKAVRNWAMPAISPDGRYVVENNAPLPGPPGGSDGIFEMDTGVQVAGSGLEGVLLDMPAFGPRGHKIAYVSHDAPFDLRSYDFDLNNGVASNPQLLVPAGTDTNTEGICFPSVSPTISDGAGDATYVVYHRGTRPGSLDTRFGPGDLYLASADTPGVEWRLEGANGDNYPFAAGNRDRSFNYEPTFAPAATGGYMWVVFTSRRTYGNRLTGGSGAVKQLWMVAIDPFPEPGKDPSHPAFWLPGQDASTLNMRGYWALDPCIQPGDMCTDSGECCDGQPCVDGMCGGGEECAETGEFCDGAADCCDPNAVCVANECAVEAPR